MCVCSSCGVINALFIPMGALPLSEWSQRRSGDRVEERWGEGKGGEEEGDMYLVCKIYEKVNFEKHNQRENRKLWKCYMVESQI